MPGLHWRAKAILWHISGRSCWPIYTERKRHPGPDPDMRCDAADKRGRLTQGMNSEAESGRNRWYQCSALAIGSYETACLAGKLGAGPMGLLGVSDSAML